MHRAALKIAETGRPVFPCRPAPDKSPLTKRGFKDATTDQAKINAFWNANHGASIGVPTGKESGFWVLDVDVDPDKGIDGFSALEELEKEHGKLPLTLTVRTPRGGFHHFFTHVEGITNKPGGLPEGMDVRGQGGYVLSPPSPGYTVEVRAEIAPAPQWLLELIVKRKPPAETRSRRRRHRGIAPGEPIPEGVRNCSLFGFGLDLSHQGLSPGEVLEELLAINEQRCSPPLDTAEVKKIAGSACRPEYARRRKKLTPEALELIAALEKAWLATAWKGVGGKTEASVLRSLMVMAKRHGELITAGIRVSLSVRDLALAAGVSFVTVSRVTKRLRQKGILRKDDAYRTGPEAGAFVLLDPRPTVNTQTPPSPQGVESVNTSSRPGVADLATRHYRWRGLVNKSRERTLCVLEVHGPQSAEELAERLGWSRVRDLRLRHLDVLVEAGLALKIDGAYSIATDYEAAQEIVRETPYSVNDGPSASEVQREALDRQRHERQRQAFREDWEEGLIFPGYASKRRERAIEREMERTGAVLVEFAGVEDEDLERIVDEFIEGSREVFEMAKGMFEVPLRS